ncbi:MAG TPA: hypothetical protein GXX35_05805 [Thermoanaerobacterales bacterium]|nr:hypothetical protein [Thermoanaerobacterales bacterium]
MDFSLWIRGLTALIQPSTIGWLILSSVIGYITGALPGMGAALTISLLIPITYYLDPAVALIIMGTIFTICVYGGSLSAILLNVPGTAGSAATCMDGYMMAKNGQAKTALGISTGASFIGSIGSTILLVVGAQVLLKPMLALGSSEYFWITVLGLTIIASLSDTGMVKGFIGGCIGLLLSFVGQELVTGTYRYTFGSLYLISGLELVAIIIGFFGVSEVIGMMVGKEISISKVNKLSGSVWEGMILPFKYLGATIKSFIIGFLVGVMPGVGYSISTWLAYNEVKRTSKHPEDFGKGSVEGVIAPEVSNNSTVGGSLLPTLLLGIPGSDTAAVILAGMIAHGIMPGPQLLSQRADLVYTFFIGLLVAGFFIIIMGLAVLPFAAKVTVMPLGIVAPIVTILCFAGALSINVSVNDVVVVVLTGILGYVMKKLDYPIVTVVLGFVLGPIMEENMNRAMLAVGGSIKGLFVSPLSWIFIILVIASVGQSIYRQLKNKNKKEALV